MLRQSVKHIYAQIRNKYLNFKLFGKKGLDTCPIWFSPDIRCRDLKKNTIEIHGEWAPNMIQLGRKGSPFVPIRMQTPFISIRRGKLIFEGKCTIAEGFSIFIDGGDVVFGKNVYVNRNLMLQCEQGIDIGENVLFGWNICIRDTDGHALMLDGEKQTYRKSVKIGSDTWVAADCTILKGTEIASHCVVGCNSLVTGKKYTEQNCLIAGFPAGVIKHKIDWMN